MLLSTTLYVAPADAQEAAAAKIAGFIVARESGLPIGNASVNLYQGTKVVAGTTTDGAGNFQFPSEPAGAYSILVTAGGYRSTRVADIFAAAGTTATIQTALIRAATSSNGSLREIGQTTARATGQTLAATSTIQTTLVPPNSKRRVTSKRPTPYNKYRASISPAARIASATTRSSTSAAWAKAKRAR